MTRTLTALLGLGALGLLAPAGGALAADLEGELAWGIEAGDPDFDSARTQALARVGYRLTHALETGAGTLDLVASGEASADAPELNETHLLREAYAEIATDAGRFGIGRRVPVQGVADGFVPTDVVAPRNFRMARYETEADRFGLDGAWGTVFLGESVSLSGYVYDGRRSNVMPKGLYPGPLELPEAPLESEGAVHGGRLSHMAEIGDFGLSVYRGAAAYPVLVPEGFAIAARVPDLDMIGLDADTVFGPWRVYGEAALLRYSPGEGGLAPAFMPDDEVQAVAGVEREFEGGDRLGVQVFHRALRGARDPLPGAGPAAALSHGVRGLYGQFDSRQQGASVSYTWSSEDTRWAVEASAATWFTDDHYLGLRSKYRLTDQSAVYLDGAWLDGPDDSLFGAFRGSSSLSLEYRHFF